MTWMSRKNMTLQGRSFAPGDVVPQNVIDSIAPGRLGSLTRLNMLQEVTPVQASEFAHPPAPVESPFGEGEEQGEMCPECGAGPFQRLAQHISRTHESEE